MARINWLDRLMGVRVRGNDAHTSPAAAKTTSKPNWLSRWLVRKVGTSETTQEGTSKNTQEVTSEHTALNRKLTWYETIKGLWSRCFGGVKDSVENRSDGRGSGDASPLLGRVSDIDRMRPYSQDTSRRTSHVKRSVFGVSLTNDPSASLSASSLMAPALALPSQPKNDKTVSSDPFPGNNTTQDSPRTDTRASRPLPSSIPVLPRKLSRSRGLSAASDASASTDPTAQKRAQNVQILREIFGQESVSYTNETYFIKKQTAITASLNENLIAYTTTQSSQELTITSDDEMSKWCTSLTKLQAAQKKINEKFQECFMDNTGNWNISLQRNDRGLYQIQIGNPRENDQRKEYAVFALLKDLNIINRDVVFETTTQLPLLRGSEVIRIQQYFEEQEQFMAQFKQVFQSLDSDAVVCIGTAPNDNLFKTLDSTLEQDSQRFKNEYKIEKTLVDAIRKENGGIIYPGAVQIKTKSDTLMTLLESYYMEFGFKDRMGNPKTFITPTRAKGQEHLSNMSKEQFTILQSRINRLMFVQKKCGLTLKEAMECEVKGTLVNKFAEVRGDRLRAMILDANGITGDGKMELLGQIEALKSVRKYTEVEAAEDKIWKEMLLNHTSIDKKSLDPLPQENTVQAHVNRVLYPSSRPSHDHVARIQAQCQKIQETPVFLAANQRGENNALELNLNQFQTITQQKIRGGDNSPLFMTGLEMFEKIAYRLCQGNLPSERYDQFFLAMQQIDWVGCAQGYTAKIQELLTILSGEQGIDQTLAYARVNLVTEFVDVHYADSVEKSMYLGGLKNALNQELGLGQTATITHEWGANHKEAAKTYVTSNFTPVFVCDTIYSHLKSKVADAINSNSYEDFNQLMTELGVSEEDRRKYDRVEDGADDEEDDEAFNWQVDGAEIQFDLPVLVMNYCVRNHYLQWGGNKSNINPVYNRNTYGQHIASQKRAAQTQQALQRQAAEREYQAAAQQNQRRPQSYYQPNASPVIIGGG